MRVFSLIEPWATLVARNYKRLETRSWSTPYTGLVAIHSSQSRKCADMGPELIRKAGMEPPPNWPEPGEYPFGKIICIGNLEGCAPSSVWQNDKTVAPSEFIFGDLSPGRFGWRFGDIWPVKPLPFKGTQGLRDLPREIEAQLEYLNGMPAVRLPDSWETCPDCSGWGFLCFFGKADCETCGGRGQIPTVTGKLSSTI